MSYAQIQRGLLRSVMLAPLDAVSSVGFSIVLIGLLARAGGMELVGQWAMLQAYVAIALAFDLGVTYGVNRRVASEGPEGGFALIARAGGWPLALAALGLLTAAGGAGFGVEGWLPAAAVALAAGATQLLTQWFGAVQTGAHRHAHTQAASIFLNVVQFCLILLALSWSSGPPAIWTLAAAIWGARLLHLAFTIALLALAPLGLAAFAAAPRRAPWAEVRAAAGAFTFYSLAVKWRIPLLRLSVGFLGGDAALGLFTIAQRAPEAISAVFSSGLQTLLAGFAGLGKGAEATRLLRRALEVQVALCLPLFLAFFAHAPAILTLWIGSVDADLVLMTRLMALAGILSAPTVPFSWALQATGQASFMAVVIVVQTALIVTVGAIGFGLTDHGTLVFVAGFAFLAATANMIYAARAIVLNFGGAAVLGWIRDRRVWLVVPLNIAAAAAGALGAAEAGIVELILRVAAYGAVSLAISWFAFRPERFRRKR